jgi:DNA-binding response OmpR family regulator
MKKKPVKPTSTPVKSRSQKEAGKGECRGCLLLVEDHPPTRNSIAKLLSSLRFDVHAAASIAEAWELVAEKSFDFLVSDIGLPDGDGFLLMRELQHRFGMRGIALTGFDSDEDAALSREAGFSAHLVKPVELKVLDEVLSSNGI